MSGVYIQGIVDNIKNDSTPYMPVVEAITNSIDSIEKSERTDGRIDIYLDRAQALIPDEEQQDVLTVRVVDNGVGFNDDNRKSFDTLYSPQKKEIGGKGFGRFFYLKHFSQVFVKSVYERDDGKFAQRSFEFGRQYDVVVGEKVEDTAAKETGSEVVLKNLKQGKYDKDPEIFAHRLMEKLLSYFVDQTYICPTIVLHDEDALPRPLVLNSLIGSDSDSLIQLKKEDKFEVNGVTFGYKMFKLLHPRNQKSRIFLTARNQAVTDTSLDTYVPEFASDFVEKVGSGEQKKERNYIVRFYIQGDYLNQNVTAERDNFNFGLDKDAVYPVSIKDIEVKTAEIAKEEFSEQVTVRLQKKKAKILQYAEQNVWYKPYIDELDYTNIKVNLSEAEIEGILHSAKFKKDLDIKARIQRITSEQNYSSAHEAAENIIKEAKTTSVSDLAHYVAFRKSILELFKTTVRLTEEGSYESEQAVHDLIFPTKTDSEETPYDGHNLWILDERLTFTQYISSDKNLYKGKNRDRPDIAAFYHEVAYRETNESYSPISIFEFKKPGRYDFVNPSSTENPFEQIKRYVSAIKNGELKSIDGLEIQVGTNTPFYGYIVADADKHIREWLTMQDFSPLPDGQGWFYRHKEMNLYVEYITWSKLIRDAEIRHRKFFELLGVA